jgi:leader peptidase (prepilin peptidase)/N-methyltransferase
LIELITGLAFVLMYTHIVIPQDFTLTSFVVFLFSAVVASLLIVITVYDVRHKIIPTKISYPFVALGFVSIIWKVATIPGFSFLNAVLAGLLLAAPFFFLWFFSKGRWMGFGDVVLALGMGWLVGISGAITVFLLSFWIGAIAGLVLIAFSKAYGIKSEVPFAPFLVIALFIVAVFGVTLSTLFPIWP